MTKEELRKYSSIKTELTELNRLCRRIKCKGEQSDDLDELYQKKRKQCVELLTAIETAIEQLNPIERTLMRLRYIDGLPWQMISARTNYSWSQVHRIHKNALAKLAET